MNNVITIKLCSFVYYIINVKLHRYIRKHLLEYQIALLDILDIIIALKQITIVRITNIYIENISCNTRETPETRSEPPLSYRRIDINKYIYTIDDIILIQLTDHYNRNIY